jgi:hypothetical protein
METKAKRCVHCNKVVEASVWENHDGPAITYGMCDSCRKKVEMMIKQYCKSRNKLTNQLEGGQR